MYAKYYDLRYMILKICTSSQLARLLDRPTASKFVLFSASDWKDEKLIKNKPTTGYVKTEPYKLYSRDFEYFCQMS